LTSFGGHRHAAGLKLGTSNLERFREEFNKIVSATLKERDREDAVLIDAELSSEDVTEELIEELELLEPFGEGNPEPVFCMRDLKVAGARIVGEKHLKLRMTDNMVMLDAIGFGMGHHDVAEDDVLDVAFVPQKDTWRGNGAVQLKLKGMSLRAKRGDPVNSI
jgi:single-stranded-DNA-specific exonuclease